jgi:hypothetical protein
LRTSARTLTTAVLGVTVAVAAAAACATAAATVPAAALSGHVTTFPSDWSQTDANAAASRANHHERILTTGTVSGLVRQHRFIAPEDTAGDCGAIGNSAPVLTGGHVIEIANDVVAAYSADTSQRLWSATLDASKTTVFNSIAVADGVVVVGGQDCVSHSDPNGVEKAFNAVTGDLMWSTNTSPAGGALEQLVVSGDSVVARGVSAGSGAIVSVRSLLTGGVVWFNVFGECGESDNMAVVGGNVVYSHCDADGDNPVLEADNLTTGAPAWSRAGVWSVERGDTDAVTARHLLAVGPRGNLDDMVPSTGAIRHSLPGARDALVVGTSLVFTTCGTAQVCAYKLSNHSELWSVDDASTLAAEAGGVLYLADGKLLSVRTGALITSIGRHSASNALVVGDGRVARTHNNRTLLLYALRGV